jgi:hypothetical protein
MKTCSFALFVLLAAPSFAQQPVPEIPFDSVPDYPKLPPGMNFGEVPGVAVNSRGHVFVFTRSNSAGGPAYGPAAAQLLEFGPRGEFLREIGKGLYAWSEAHTVRIDKDDNIWAIDKGSDMIIKFNQAGRVVMTFGRRAEASDEGAKPWEHRERGVRRGDVQLARAEVNPASADAKFCCGAAINSSERESRSDYRQKIFLESDFIFYSHALQSTTISRHEPQNHCDFRPSERLHLFNRNRSQDRAESIEWGLSQRPRRLATARPHLL